MTTQTPTAPTVEPLTVDDLKRLAPDLADVRPTPQDVLRFMEARGCEQMAGDFVTETPDGTLMACSLGAMFLGGLELFKDAE